MEREETGYALSTESQLRHYFSGVGLLRDKMKYGHVSPEEAYGTQRRFVDGIKLTIEQLTDGRIKALTRHPYIGFLHLRRILEVAESEDWTQPATIRKLYEVYSDITGDPIKENLFEGI